MDVKYLQAANAYSNPAKMMQGMGSADDSGESTPSASFSGMLGDALQNASSTLRQSETLQTQALTSNKPVELSDLVTAVANAELTVNTVVAVRDRIISAYQDIIRMPI